MSAYESKALYWPPFKSEDGSALSRFSVYLASCKNTMKGSQYSSKFDQPDNMRKLIFKLPHNMRERWRRVVDDIMELQGRPVKFDDLVSFIPIQFLVKLQRAPKYSKLGLVREQCRSCYRNQES